MDKTKPMNELREQFEKEYNKGKSEDETIVINCIREGCTSHCQGDDAMEYIEWLEAKLSRLNEVTDEEIESFADRKSLLDGLRDRMIHYEGLKQGAKWYRNKLKQG